MVHLIGGRLFLSKWSVVSGLRLVGGFVLRSDICCHFNEHVETEIVYICEVNDIRKFSMISTVLRRRLISAVVHYVLRKT